MYLIGIDLGSSSVKASLVNGNDGSLVASEFFPKTEMTITAIIKGWAEQSPDMWWKYIKMVIQKVLKKSEIDKEKIKAIGISYQMHGLVAVDKNGEPVRDSIIWCDSRAVKIGDSAFQQLGSDFCLGHYLNSPGNFTASKLKWVKENEPFIYEKIDKIMLPGDYIAYKLTGKAKTTISGLSEGILWDFKQNSIAKELLKNYGMDESLIPEITDTFSNQGTILKEVAEELGLSKNTIISYRSGDRSMFFRSTSFLISYVSSAFILFISIIDN